MKSLYDRIHVNILANGKLSSSFALRGEHPGVYEGCAEGIFDGMDFYHGDTATADVSRIWKVLRLAMEGKVEESETALREAYDNEKFTTFDYVKDNIYTQDETIDLDSDNIDALAKHLLFHTDDVEAAKFAMWIFSKRKSVPTEAVHRAIREFGAVEEFGYFAAAALLRFPTGNEDVFYMAKKLHGWGKIFAVEFLRPSTEAIRHWLLHEGLQNSIMEDYSAFAVATKLDLESLLLGNNEEDFKAACEVVYALLGRSFGPPVKRLSDHPNEIGIIQAAVKKSEISPSEAAYRLLFTLKAYCEAMEGDTAEKDGQYLMLSRDARNVFASKECSQFLAEEIKKGNCLNLAQRLGFDCTDAIKAALKADWKKNWELVHFLKKGKDIEEVAEHFSQAAEQELLAPRALPCLWNFCYDRLLASMSGYSMEAEHFLMVGLKAAYAGNRRSALSRLRNWKKKKWLTRELRHAIREWRKNETDAEMLHQYRHL